MVLLVRYEPRWILFAALSLGAVASIGIVPFKGNLEVLRYVGLGLAVLALGFGLRAAQKRGWSLTVEGNILYLQRFHLYSNWQQRRSEELVMPIGEMHEFQIQGSKLTVVYGQRKHTYHLHVGSLGSDRRARLDLLIAQVQSMMKA